MQTCCWKALAWATLYPNGGINVWLRTAKKLQVMSSVDFLGEGEIFCYSETEHLVGFRVRLHCLIIVVLGWNQISALLLGCPELVYRSVLLFELPRLGTARPTLLAVSSGAWLFLRVTPQARALTVGTMGCTLSVVCMSATGHSFLLQNLPGLLSFSATWGSSLQPPDCPSEPPFLEGTLPQEFPLHPAPSSGIRAFSLLWEGAKRERFKVDNQVEVKPYYLHFLADLCAGPHGSSSSSLCPRLP